MSLADHAVVLPIVLPLAAGAATLMLDEDRVVLRASMSLACTLLLLLVAVGLVRLADESFATVYRLGNWPAPFGIVLVLDRVAAILVLLTAMPSTAVSSTRIAATRSSTSTIPNGAGQLPRR